MTIEWTYPLPGAPQASTAAVADAEATLGVRFPADFLAIATVLQGASPEPFSIRLPDGHSSGFGSLLHFEEEPPFTNIVARRWPLEDWLPQGITPFAESSGDLWCFDFRSDPVRPKIVYYAHDDPDLTFPPVAESFTDLLSKIS